MGRFNPYVHAPATFLQSPLLIREPSERLLGRNAGQAMTAGLVRQLGALGGGTPTFLDSLILKLCFYEGGGLTLSLLRLPGIR